MGRMPPLIGSGSVKPLMPCLNERLPVAIERPEHGGKLRVEGGHVAHHPVVDKAFQVGHLARVHQRIDHLPIGGVPTDQQHLFCQRICHVFHYTNKKGPAAVSQQAS